MLVTYYNQYYGLKPKDSEEFILNQGLMKEVKFRKWESCITEKQEVLSMEKRNNIFKFMAKKNMINFLNT